MYHLTECTHPLTVVVYNLEKLVLYLLSDEGTHDHIHGVTIFSPLNQSIVVVSVHIFLKCYPAFVATVMIDVMIRDFCQSILVNGICSVMWFGAVCLGFFALPSSDGRGMGNNRVKSLFVEPMGTLLPCLVLCNFCLLFLVHQKDIISSKNWLLHHWNENTFCIFAG